MSAVSGIVPAAGDPLSMDIFQESEQKSKALVQVLKQACSRNKALEKRDLWKTKDVQDHGSATTITLKSNKGEVVSTITRVPLGAKVTANSVNKYEEDRQKNAEQKEDVSLHRFCDGKDNAWRPDSFFSEACGEDIPPWPVRPQEIFSNPQLCLRIMNHQMEQKQKRKAEKALKKAAQKAEEGVDKKAKKTGKKDKKKKSKKDTKAKKKKKKDKEKTDKKARKGKDKRPGKKVKKDSKKRKREQSSDSSDQASSDTESDAQISAKGIAMEVGSQSSESGAGTPPLNGVGVAKRAQQSASGEDSDSSDSGSSSGD